MLNKVKSLSSASGMLYYHQIRIMKWMSNKYAYPLVALAVLASVGLQSAWLGQLFRVQQVQVKRDLEQAVNNAARMNDYLSAVQGHEGSENFRKFFLSPEWVQFKQAFTAMRAQRVASRYSSHIDKDSTIIDISLRVANGKPQPRRRGRVVRVLDDGETMESAIAADRRDLKRMDSLVRCECQRNQLNVKSYYLTYNFDTGKPESPERWKAAQRADYRSDIYAYNLNFFFHNYQLVVPSINGLVYYRMRYYLISSLLMLLLTGLAFIFLFRVMRSQRLYTQARMAFTGNMTHELKTPVAVIEAALDAITRYQLSRDPVKLDNYIDISKSELRRLNLMIDKVLNLDQLDNGQVKLRPELYDVQQGLNSVVTSMRLRNGQKETTIIYVPSPEPCFVDGDPVHLTNVFYNLIDNSLKYSGSHARITVSCNCNQDTVHISIEDNGPGIAKIYKERIFERFFRVPDHPDIHNVKGSGLGLYYVRQIIEKHGGHIQLRSETGKGSNFKIDLPAYHEV
jgi:signal transduction histidine kinase